jgi:hypothetical protein
MNSHRKLSLVACAVAVLLGSALANADEAVPAIPVPVVGLQAGSYHYATHVSAGGQELDIPSTLEIKDSGTTWSVTETADMPMGQAVDHAELTKPTLNLVRRSAEQGPVSLNFEVATLQLKGDLKVNGQIQALAAPLSSPLIADGPGAAAVIATLPLAEGYKALLAAFNPQTQQLVRTPLTVVATEKIKVAGGEFESWKVELASPLGPTTTLWIAKAERKLIRSVLTAPQLNGGSITMELVP